MHRIYPMSSAGPLDFDITRFNCTCSYFCKNRKVFISFWENNLWTFCVLTFSQPSFTRCVLIYIGFVNGSEFTDQCSPAPAAVPLPSSSASSTPPTAKADLPSVKKRQKRSKSGAKGDGSADGGILLYYYILYYYILYYIILVYIILVYYYIWDTV